MSLSKIKDILALTNEQIEKEILESKRLSFEVRLLKGSRQFYKPHNFRILKHKINQLFMVKSQRESRKEGKT